MKKRVLKFSQFLNEEESRKFSLENFVKNPEPNPDSEKMLDELREELIDSKLGMPELEETGTMNYNSMYPSFVADLSKEDFASWKKTSWKIGSREGMDFLEKLDKDWFLEERVNGVEKYDFVEIESPAPLSQFAAKWGFLPYIISYTSDDVGNRKPGVPYEPSSGPFYDMHAIIIVFVHDEEIARANRGSISSKRYGV